MTYILTVLTNGRPEYLARTLAAFRELVTPQPTRVYVFDDGGTTPMGVIQDPFPGAQQDFLPQRIGMCAAHGFCWRAAAQSGFEWAFHIEDDYRILCPINLGVLQKVMGKRPELVQMTLKRGPWGAEVEHGGYIEQTPGWYEARSFGARWSGSIRSTYETYDVCGARWFETIRNWACAPTLFRTETAAAFPWSPTDGCETEIGPRILESQPEAKFGIWGAGEIHCAHMGVHRAKGSHGY